MGVGALAERVVAGDRAAFAEMYSEFADGIFGFCVVLLRDRDEASDAMHDTFVLAAQRIDQLRDPERLGAWLFAIARHVCYGRSERRRRVTPVATVPDIVVLDDDPGEGLAAAECAALVREAASGLNERDRAVLYLYTRQGLEGADLAAALGVQHANPYSLLNRVKQQLERAIAVLLVARLGRRECSSLAGMLHGWNGTLTPLLRKRLGRHVDGCDACQHTRSRALPMSALAATPLFVAERADAMSGMSADDLFEIASHRPIGRERWRADGFPPDGPRRRRLLVVLLSFAILGIATATGVAVAAGADGGRPVPPRPSHEARPAPARKPIARAPRTTTVPRSTTTTAPSPVIAPVASPAATIAPTTVAPPTVAVVTPLSTVPSTTVPRTTTTPPPTTSTTTTTIHF